MHILGITLAAHDGGAARALCGLLSWCAKQENTSTALLTLDYEDRPSAYTLENVHHSNIAPPHSIKNIPSLRRIYAVYKLRKFLKAQRNSAFVVLSFIDAINISALFASIGLNIPILISERTDSTHHKISWMTRFLRWIIYRRAKMLIVQTPSLMPYFASHNVTVRAIANATHINVSHKPSENKHMITSHNNDELISQKGLHIVCVARLTAMKDHPTLFKAFARYIIDYPQGKLTLVGDGEDRQKLENLAKSMSIASHVHFAGRQNHVEDFLTMGDIFVLPSRYEGFPNALLEAMALGCCVVATRVSGSQDLIQHEESGLLFNVGDTDALHQILLHLTQHPEKRLAYGRKALYVREAYDPDKIYHQWFDVLAKAATPT